MLPVRIWIRNRWFLLEDGNLFLDQSGDHKNGGE